MKLDDWIPLAKLGKLLPEKPSLSSLNRWWLRGIRGERMQTYLRGGRRYGTIADAEDFFARVTAAADGGKTPSRTKRQQLAAVRRAAKELEDAGI